MAFLAKFDTKWDMKKPYLVIEHSTQAKACSTSQSGRV